MQSSPDGLVARALIVSLPAPVAIRRSRLNEPLGARGRGARADSTGGTQLLFEIYQRFSSVNASGARLLGALAPPLIGAIVVLVLSRCRWPGRWPGACSATTASAKPCSRPPPSLRAGAPADRRRPA